MTYSNYAGNYLEGLIWSAKEGMNNIKKYKSFNLSLLQTKDIVTMERVINSACDKVKELDFYRYKNARKYSDNTMVSKLDHFLAIDDILYNDEDNIAIGIDWTVNLNSINDKVIKHSELREAINTVVDCTCVVGLSYEDALDNLDEADLAKAIYNLLKIVNKSVKAKTFKGYVLIDARDLI
jgi:hypothetical protein